MSIISTATGAGDTGDDSPLVVNNSEKSAIIKRTETLLTCAAAAGAVTLGAHDGGGVDGNS